MDKLDESNVLSNIKLDLGIEVADTLQDDLIIRLITKVCDHFKLAYSVDDIDSKFSFIIEDCVIKRFNKRGAEGASAETIEGHTVHYEDVQYEFQAYDDLLQRELEMGKKRPGKVVFL